MDELPGDLRRERLAALVAEEGFVRVADASAVFGVSEVTLRSDLRALEKAGSLQRVHGGAMPRPGGARESTVEANQERGAATKRAIGRKGAALVTSGSSLILDVGSTTLAVAHALVDRVDLTDVTVITNGLSIALALEPAIPRFSVVVTGGTLRPLQHSLVNPLATRWIEDLSVDLAIIGCNGVDAEGRVTNVNLPETEVKRSMMAAAASCALVVDGSKIGARHLSQFGTLANFRTLVTNGTVEPAFRELCEQNRTRLVLSE